MIDPVAREAALAPLRAALLARANHDADEARTAAAEAGRQAVDAARAQQDAVLADARTQGAADTAAVLASERTRARRESRGVVLRAQRDAYDLLRTRAQEAVRKLLSEPQQRDRLVATVRRQLGNDAAIVEHPTGGVVGTSGDGRTVNASVAALVDGALADLDLEQLWAPA